VSTLGAVQFTNLASRPEYGPFVPRLVSRISQPGAQIWIAHKQRKNGRLKGRSLRDG
jgi:hypothetical protein